MRMSDWSSDVCSSDRRLLVRAREAECAQRVEEAKPLRRRRDLRQVAADMPFFKGLRGGLGGRARRFGAAAHRRRLVREDLLRLVDLRAFERFQPRDLVERQVGEQPQEPPDGAVRSEEHTSELQSLLRTPYAVFCLTTNIIRGD